MVLFGIVFFSIFDIWVVMFFLLLFCFISRVWVVLYFLVNFKCEVLMFLNDKEYIVICMCFYDLGLSMVVVLFFINKWKGELN